MVGYLCSQKGEVMTGAVHNKLRDIHTIKYSIPTKIKILRIFNDIRKYYIILSEKSETQNCVYFHCYNAYILYMHGKILEGNTPKY